MIDVPNVEAPLPNSDQLAWHNLVQSKRDLALAILCSLSGEVVILDLNNAILSVAVKLAQFDEGGDTNG